MDAVELDPDEVARRSADAMQRGDAAGREAGVRLLEVGPGWARVGLAVAARHVNGHGICHGGYVFLLADAAFAYACNSHGVSAVAAGADITFLRPVPVGAELVAEAVERALVGRSGLYDVTVRVGTESVAEFRGRARQVPGLAPPQ
jgi:acyl-CoA thioesterase